MINALSQFRSGQRTKTTSEHFLFNLTAWCPSQWTDLESKKKKNLSYDLGLETIANEHLVWSSVFREILLSLCPLIEIAVESQKKLLSAQSS
jgi:hypothetical protein